MAALVTIRVRFDGGAYQRVRLAPGMSEGGVERAVAGAVGLAVGTFFIRDADGVVEGFHAGLAGDYDAVLLPGQPGAGPAAARGAGAGGGGVAVEDARIRALATEVALEVAAEYEAARRRSSSGSLSSTRVQAPDLAVEHARDELLARTRGAALAALGAAANPTGPLMSEPREAESSSSSSDSDAVADRDGDDA